MKKESITKVDKSDVIYCGMMNVCNYANDFFKDKYVWEKIVSTMELDSKNTLGDGNLPQKVVLNDEQREEIQTFYYEGLINSLYPKENLSKKSPFSYINHYKLTIEQDIPLFADAQDDKQLTVNVKSIHFYLFTKELLVFTIEVNNNEKTLEQITTQNYTIRQVDMYFKAGLSKTFLKLYTPMIYLHNRFANDMIQEDSYDKDVVKNYTRILFRGSKLKTFMVVQLPDIPDLFTSEYTFDNLLYELSTCSKIGLMCEPDNFSFPDKSYYEKLITENTVSCFSNWKGMALMDAFCVLIKTCDNQWAYSSWKEMYFEYIYLNAFFIRSFLVLMNEKYKKHNISEELENEFLEFDKTFNFHSVSYNFLPQLLYKKIRLGLEINDEIEELNNKIHTFSEKKDRLNERSMNRFLMWLAILAVFSALNDALQLFDVINWPFPVDKSWIGSVSLMLVFIMILYYVVFRKKK